MQKIYVIRLGGSTVVFAGASRSRASQCLGGWEMEESAAIGLSLGCYYGSGIEDYSIFWCHLVGRKSRSPHAGACNDPYFCGSAVGVILAQKAACAR